MPPLAEQRRIVAKLDSLLGKLRAARDLLDAARESFALRRAAILHKAFSGQLTAAWRKEHPDLARPEFEECQEQPYKIPETWAWVKIGEMLKLEYGKSLPENNRSGKGFPVYGSNGVVGYHEKTLIKSPAIIVGRKGSIGAINWSNDDCWPIDTTYYVKTNETVILSFSYYFLFKF